VDFGTERGFSFGKYDSLARSQAANPQGLLANESLLKLLLGCSPRLKFSMTTLRKPINDVVNMKPRMNDASYNNSIWSSLKAERILTMCNHLRRLAREPARYKQAAAKCSGEELEKLCELCAMVEVDCQDMEVRRNKGCSQQPSVASSSSSKPPKELKKQDSIASNMSMDSQGFPKLDFEEMESALCSPKTKVHKKRIKPGKVVEGQVLKDNAKKKQVHLPKVVQSKHGEFKITFATKQSYVHLNHEFLVAITEKQAGVGKRHQLMYNLVKQLVGKSSVSKELSRKCRDALLG